MQSERKQSSMVNNVSCNITATIQVPFQCLKDFKSKLELSLNEQFKVQGMPLYGCTFIPVVLA